MKYQIFTITGFKNSKVQTFKIQKFQKFKNVEKTLLPGVHLVDIGRHYSLPEYQLYSLQYIPVLIQDIFYLNFKYRMAQFKASIICKNDL